MAVQIWVEKLPYRSIEIPNSRPQRQRKGETEEQLLARVQRSDADPKKHLTFAHREVMRVLADHARHNGLSWPGMPTIAEEAGIKQRQAYNIVKDLDLARLVKVHEGGGRSRSNHYWVRVPWVEEPECVLDLPVLDNRHFPPGVKLKNEEGKPPRIDVDYYVRVSRLKTLQPVTGFIEANEETLQPATPFVGETLQPVAPFEAETLQPVAGEPPLFRESSSSFESPSPARAAREKNGEHEKDEDRAEHVQPTLPRFSALFAPGDTLPHSAVIRTPGGLVYKALEAPHEIAGVEMLQAEAEPARMERCPDCGNAVTVKGDGHRGGTDACRAYGRGGDVQRCPVCNEWIGEQGQIRDKPLAPSIWHTIWCRLRDDHAAPSQWADIEDQVSDRRALAREPAAPGAHSPDETALSETSKARAAAVNGNDAAIRARLAEKLSADELARLDELERQRVAYAAESVVPVAAAQDGEAESDKQPPSSVQRTAVAREENNEAPRRRRKKERAVA